MTRRSIATLILCLMALLGPLVERLTARVPSNQLLLGKISPTYSSSSTRTMPTPKERVIDVRSCGAVGDGAVDDARAIQAAINACAAGGLGTVFFPAGQYRFTTTLTVPSNVTVEGVSSEVHGAVAGSVLIYDGRSIGIRACNVSEVVIHKLALVASIWYKASPYPEYAGTHGIELYQAGRFLVDDVYVEGFATSGIHLTASFPDGYTIVGEIHHCNLYNNGGDGILADGVNAINQIYIHGNRIHANRQSGISFHSAGCAIAIIGNDIEGNAGQVNPDANGEVYLEGGYIQAISIINNYFETSGMPHPVIRVAMNQDAYGLTIQDNVMGVVARYPYAIELAKNATVRGLMVTGNSVCNVQYLLGNKGAGPSLCGAQIGPNRLGPGIKNIQNLRGSGVEIVTESGIFPLGYGSIMTPDCSEGKIFSITATNSSDFKINNPINAATGMERTFIISNRSGGGLGKVTWGEAFRLSAWSDPANGESAAIQFVYDGKAWIEAARTGTGPQPTESSYDYSGSAIWAMSATEAQASLFTVAKAGCPADAVFPAATPGKQFTVYNNSGQPITFKVAGQPGAVATSGKYSIWAMNKADCVKIYEQP